MIREDWVEVELSEVCDIYTGTGFPKKYQGKKSGEYPFYKVGDISKNVQSGYKILKLCDNYIEREVVNLIKGKLVPKHSIVFAKIGEALKLNRRAITDTTCLIDNNVTGIRYKNESMNFLFLYYNFLLIRLEEYSRATTVPSVRKSDIEKIKLPLAPLPEQRAIVAKIEELFSELDSGIDSLKKAKEQLEVYRQAVLKAAFEGKLTREWRKENKSISNANDLLEKIEKERANYYEGLIKRWKDEVREWEKGNKEEKKPSKPRKISDINHVDDNELPNDLPNSWDWTRLSNLVLDASKDIVDGPFGSNLKSTEYVDEGYPVLRIQNIKANKFINKNFRYISVEKYNALSRHQFKPEDLIVTKLGNPLGLTCRVPSYMGEGVIVADLIRISPSLKNINYEWLTYLLNSEVIQAQFREITKGTTRPRMNLTIMRDTLVPICPIEEQNEIVQEIESRLSVCENIEATIEEALEKSEALRQSILKKAFEGKLLSSEELEACRGESDWEPAKALLKKIKEDKKGAKSNG